ncbi:hypothetical protein [Streptomyces sp. F001]|nr:hypothetical protein [Streptomyces sp. F001]
MCFGFEEIGFLHRDQLDLKARPPSGQVPREGIETASPERRADCGPQAIG